jgi:hypothetical protein
MRGDQTVGPWLTSVIQGFSSRMRHSSATSVTVKLGFCLIDASLLAVRAPVELGGHLLEHDLGAADATGQPGAVVHPVPIIATRHRAPVGLGSRSSMVII